MYQFLCVCKTSACSHSLKAFIIYFQVCPIHVMDTQMQDYRYSTVIGAVLCYRVLRLCVHHMTQTHLVPPGVYNNSIEWQQAVTQCWVIPRPITQKK